MKATHTERENWRTPEPSTQFWYSKLNDTEQFVIRFTIIVAVIFTIAYVMANIDVLEIVRVINDFAANVITEVISIAVTVLIIERLNQRRATEQQKAELILQMGSSDNSFAREAVRKLGHYGWIKDGSLQGVDLKKANLQKADLWEANLQEAMLQDANLQKATLGGANLQKAILSFANLQETHLSGVNLQEADLGGTNLQKTDLTGANLQEADLRNANLQEAYLRNANLRETYLWGTNLQKAILWLTNLQKAEFIGTNLQAANLNSANLREAYLGGVNLQAANLESAHLQGANFISAKLEDTKLVKANLRGAINIDDATFSSDTILPNSDKWHEGYDLTIFTDPEHPNFWEPDWVKRQREEADSE